MAAKDAGSSGWTANNAMGWAVLFVFLVILADIPATQALATTFAWLILLSVLMLFGPLAGQNIGSLFGG
jgi:uncharacterized membrane protein YhaH (DUF805 family)